jgi:hypothetical protein
MSKEKEREASATQNSSGQGRSAEIPLEIDRWNWAAFLLNWIWGIGNNTFLALLVFIPPLTLVMPFVLGFQGNRWAWQNKRWESVEHFKYVQRKWALASGIFLLLALGFIALIGVVVGVVFYAMQNSEAYRLSLARVQRSSEAIAILGQPISAGVPWGSIQVSGSRGSADLSYSVEGSKAQGTIYLDGLLEAGTWRFPRLELQVEDSEDRISLAEAASVGGSVRVPKPRTQERTYEESQARGAEALGSDALSSEIDVKVRLEKKRTEIREDIEAAKRKLSVWSLLRERLGTTGPIGLASEVAANSELAKAKKEAFEAATWEYLKAEERLQYDRNNLKLKQSVTELKRLRTQKEDEMTVSIKNAIELGLSESQEKVSTQTVELEKVEDEIAALKVTQSEEKRANPPS